MFFVTKKKYDELLWNFDSMRKYDEELFDSLRDRLDRLKKELALKPAPPAPRVIHKTKVIYKSRRLKDEQ